MLIRKANLNDVAEVATLHVHAFPNFFLTSLGISFLKELYAGFLAHPTGIFLVASDGVRIVGFIAGTSEPVTFFAELRRRRRIAFVVKAVPAILKNPLPVCRKLLYAVRYRGETPTAGPSSGGALLSSIGIASSLRGSGLASDLIAAFENEAVSSGAEFVYLTTDANDNDRVNGFYQANGYVSVARFIQSGSREMFRYEKQLSNKFSQYNE